MGLDSYIKVSKYLSPHSRETIKQHKDVTQLLNIFPDEGSTLIEISFSGLYWRNCWYMHSWFSGYEEVALGDLQQLQQDCIDVINTSDKNKQLELFKNRFKYIDIISLDHILPTLKYTVDKLSHIIHSPQYSDCVFSYESSW